MKILVAGGAGYIGSALCPALLAHGYDVTVGDHLWFGNHLPAGVAVDDRDLFEATQGDLRGFDQVVFLAGLSNDPMAEYSPGKNFIHNAALPAFLAFTAKSAGVKRFIYASTCSVYGYTVNKLYDEQAPATCAYPYGISKLQGERGVHQMQDDAFSVISLRQGTVCGYSPRMRMDLIVNTMYKTAMTTGTITINNPALWRPILHIQDAVSAFLRAIQADYSINGVFNVASGNLTVGQVGDVVKDEVEALTGKTIKMNVLDKPDMRNYKVTIEKARTQLGFEPQHDIRDIVRDLHAHLDQYGDFDDDAFYNIRVCMKKWSRQ